MELQKKDTHLYDILLEIQQELKYSKKVNQSPLWIKAKELIKSKQLPIQSVCQNLSLYIAQKLFENQIKSYILLCKKTNKAKHFCVKVIIDWKVLYVDQIKWQLSILESLPNIYCESIESLPYEWQETINEVFANYKIVQIGLYVRTIIFPLLPRQWPIKINKEKDKKREKIINQLWNKWIK